MTGYYIKQQNRTLFCKTSQQFFLWTSLIAFSSACQLDSYLSNSNKISIILGRLDAVQYFIFCFVQRDCRLLISTKCAGMGVDLPDIRVTVCIGKGSPCLPK